MKTLFKYIFVSLIVSIAVLSALKYCDRPIDGMVSVRQSFLDSLSMIANIPPKIEYKDTIIYKDTTIFKYKDKLVPVYIDTNNIKTYRDSIVSDDIDAKVDLRVDGELLSIDWRYKPIIREVTKEVTITKPEPVPYEVPTPQSGLYGGVGVGYGSGYLNLSVKTGYINKGGWIYEIEAGNFKNNYLKVGIGRVF